MREAKDRATLGGRRMALVIVALGLTLLPACSQNDNTTLVNSGADCGLVRSDLIGTWQVSFTPASVSTVICDDLSFDDWGITVNSTSRNYIVNDVFGSPSAAAFQVAGDGASTDPVNPELFGSVQADSCLALFHVWDNADAAYIQCLGIFDISKGKIVGSCDSADIDFPVGGSFEATCSLNAYIEFSVSIP